MGAQRARGRRGRIETRGRRLHLVAPEVVRDAERALVPEPIRPILGMARVSDFMLLRE